MTDEDVLQWKMAQAKEITKRWSEAFGFLRYAVVCLALIFCFRALAGRQTLADIKFALLADLKVNKYASQVLAWGLTGTTAAWAILERKLRRKDIERFTKEISVLQNVIDPRRGSSRLTHTGQTRPEDQ